MLMMGTTTRSRMVLNVITWQALFKRIVVNRDSDDLKSCKRKEIHVYVCTTVYLYI